MSRVRNRLEQYKAEIEKKSQYKHGLPGSAPDIVNTLLDDLEQDEKENGWIPVSERLPEDEKECCICCSKQDSCQCKCNTIDDYEYSEECDEYVEDGGTE